MDSTTRALVFGVLFVWIVVCLAAIVRPELIALAGLATTVISAIIAAVTAGGYNKKRKD